MLKHNKKRNSGIIYEQLLTVMTRLAAEKKNAEANFILETIKKYFNSNTFLGKERKIFSSLINSKGVTKERADKIIVESLKEARLISEAKLEKEKTELINHINKTIGHNIYKLPLKNYKPMASVQILLNEERNGYKHTTPEERVKIKQGLSELLCNNQEVEEDYKIDNLTYKILINKFNKKYSQVLNEDQKDILKGWISYLSTNDEDKLKNLLEEKLSEVKNEIKNNLFSGIHNDEEYLPMLTEAKEKLDNFKLDKIDEDVIYEAMRFCDLIEDLNCVSVEDKV